MILRCVPFFCAEDLPLFARKIILLNLTRNSGREKCESNMQVPKEANEKDGKKMGEGRRGRNRLSLENFLAIIFFGIKNIFLEKKAMENGGNWSQWNMEGTGGK